MSVAKNCFITRSSVEIGVLNFDPYANRIVRLHEMSEFVFVHWSRKDRVEMLNGGWENPRFRSTRSIFLVLSPMFISELHLLGDADRQGWALAIVGHVPVPRDLDVIGVSRGCVGVRSLAAVRCFCNVRPLVPDELLFTLTISIHQSSRRHYALRSLTCRRYRHTLFHRLPLSSGVEDSRP